MKISVSCNYSDCYMLAAILFLLSFYCTYNVNFKCFIRVIINVNRLNLIYSMLNSNLFFKELNMCNIKRFSFNKLWKA